MIQDRVADLTVLTFSRRNLFILNKFLISGKILITCRELYLEVVCHVYLIRMGYFPENEILTVKDHVQNDKKKKKSKMTHFYNKDKSNCFQIHVADSFKL